jgi:hypothetical protein
LAQQLFQILLITMFVVRCIPFMWVHFWAHILDAHRGRIQNLLLRRQTLSIGFRSYTPCTGFPKWVLEIVPRSMSPIVPNCWETTRSLNMVSATRHQLGKSNFLAFWSRTNISTLRMRFCFFFKVIFLLYCIAPCVACWFSISHPMLLMKPTYHWGIGCRLTLNRRLLSMTVSQIQWGG